MEVPAVDDEDMGHDGGRAGGADARHVHRREVPGPVIGRACALGVAEACAVAGLPSRSVGPGLHHDGVTRDGQRGRVYAAEELWRAQLDAARRGARELDLAGSTVVLPVEVRFGGLDAVRGWLDRLGDLPGREPLAGLSVRARRGLTRAHYEPPGTVALPAPVLGEPWALREAVVLHEVAHHVAGVGAGHGPGFAAAMLALVRDVLGEEAAFVLGVHYAEGGVRVSSADERADLTA